MRFIYVFILLTFASPLFALSLPECDRTTHISHGGETGHRDFGAGRVGFAEWWSQEGVFQDLTVMDCATGTFLKTRVREERISERLFDRTEAALKIIETAVQTSPSLFSFKQLARSLKGVGRDIELAKTTRETCACAALYPELIGDKTPFEVTQ